MQTCKQGQAGAYPPPHSKEKWEKTCTRSDQRSTLGFWGLHPGPRWWTFVSRIPNLPTPGKNPAGAHEVREKTKLVTECKEQFYFCFTKLIYTTLISDFQNIST